MKFTKIIATIGPACDSTSMIKKLVDAGTNAFRLNFSHGEHDYFLEIIKKIRSVNKEIPIILDTKGPEIRTGLINGGSIKLVAGKKIIFTTKKILGDSKKIFVDYLHLDELKKGDILLIDDGLIEVRVVDKNGEGVVVKVLNGGILGDKKSVSIKGHSVKIPFLSKKDKADILFGIRQDVDFIAASFVRKKEDILVLKRFLKAHGSNISIISKIEHGDAVKNIDEIIRESYGIMVARGDLGVELDLEKIPRIQAQIIHYCNDAGKPVIVATQMLESMKENPRPTRAEASDIAQAIMQGADCVMLSGETAIGKYPVKSVKMMAIIAKEYEKNTKLLSFEGLHGEGKLDYNTISLFVTRAAYLASKSLDTKAILTPTETGYTARNVSRFKPKCPILAITRNKAVLRKLQITWGVFPMIESRRYIKLDDMIKDLVKKSYKKRFIRKNDRVVITVGRTLSSRGSTNILEVFTVKDLL